MRLLRVPAALAVTAVAVAAPVAGCHLRTGPENDAQLRVRDGRGSNDGGFGDAGMPDGGGSDAGLDAGARDAGPADAMPDTPHL